MLQFIGRSLGRLEAVVITDPRAHSHLVVLVCMKCLWVSIFVCHGGLHLRLWKICFASILLKSEMRDVSNPLQGTTAQAHVKVNFLVVETWKLAQTVNQQ